MLRENLKTTLTNISELPAGFLKITHELADKFELIDEVFGTRCIKSLWELLPKFDYRDDPFNINIKEHAHFIMYVHTINKVFKKYKQEATEVAATETINFVEKIFAYIYPNYPTHKMTIETIKEACSDEYNALLMKRLLNKYGELYLTLDNDRTCNLNMYLYENLKVLIDIVNKVEDE